MPPSAPPAGAATFFFADDFLVDFFFAGAFLAAAFFAGAFWLQLS